MKPVSLILIFLVGLPVLIFIAIYNGLIKARNHCDDAWANIDTELKRRYNLIPNLVNTVKGYATHEKEVLEEVTRARQVCVDDHGSPGHQAESENQLIESLNGLLARVEDYPDLKANENFLELQDELTNTEDRIQAARRFYNGNTREYNNKVEMFPSNLIAGAFGFATREFFEISDMKMREAPGANFDS